MGGGAGSLPRMVRRPPAPPTTNSRPLPESWFFVFLTSLEDEHDVGRVLGVKVLRPITRRNARARHANRPLVTLQFVDAVLRFPLLRAAHVQVVNGLEALLGSD